MLKFIPAIALMIGLSSCQYLPQLSQDFEDIANDDVMKIEVSKGLIHPNTELHLQLDVTNGKE